MALKLPTVVPLYLLFLLTRFQLPEGNRDLKAKDPPDESSGGE